MTQAQIGISVFLLVMLLFGIFAIALFIYRVKNNKRKMAEKFQRKFGIAKDDPKARGAVEEVLISKIQEVEKAVEDAIKLLSSINPSEHAPYFSWTSYWINQNNKVEEKSAELSELKDLAEKFGFSRRF